MRRRATSRAVPTVDCLGVQALLGRTLAPGDDRPEAEAVAVISHRYWQRRFAGDLAVVGKNIYVNRTPVVIVGVTPAGFEGTRISETTDVTIPLAMAQRITGSASARPVSLWWVQIMGRLRSGVTRERVFADVQRLFDDSVQQSWAARTKTSSKGLSIPHLGIMSGSQGQEGPRRDAMPILASTFVVAGVILLIGCVNVANLVLVRTLSRRQELAVRAALGASRMRVLRQLLTESLLLALGGAAAGSVLAIWGRGFLTWLPAQQTPIVDARIDWSVLLFAAGLSIGAAVLFGFFPALRATGINLSLSVQPAQRQRRGIVRRSLVVVQMAISLVLLVVAALFVQSVNNLGRVDVGIRREEPARLSRQPRPRRRQGCARVSALRRPGRRDSSRAGRPLDNDVGASHAGPGGMGRDGRARRRREGDACLHSGRRAEFLRDDGDPAPQRPYADTRRS